MTSSGDFRSYDLSDGNAAVLSDPAAVEGGSLYAGLRDGVRVWRLDGCGAVATAARFVRHAFRPHTHDTFMFGLIERGAKTFQRERATYLAAPYSVSVVNPGDLHTGQRAAGEELRYRALYVPAQTLSDAVGMATAVGFQSGVIEDAGVFRAMVHAHDALVGGGTRLARDSLVLGALGLLASRHGGVATGDRTGAARPEIGRARALIEDRYADALSIASIAQEVALSPYHLMRQFHRQVGMPMHAYQLQVRIERARHLLARGEAPAHVALSVGFADQAHFSKRFKSLVGASPASYQRDVRRDLSGR